MTQPLSSETICGIAIKSSETILVSYDPRPETTSPATTVSGLAIAGLVVGVLGVCLGFLAPVGAVFGHIAMAQIRRGNHRGRGIAIAAVALGWAITAMWLGLTALSPRGVLDIYQGIGDFFINLVG